MRSKLVVGATGFCALAVGVACNATSVSSSPVVGQGGPTVCGAQLCLQLDEDGGSGSTPEIPSPPGMADGGVHPVFGSTVTQPVAPPPLSGGTLVVSSDGKQAWASDPDRDTLHVIDLTAGTSADVALQAGDEPGRLAVDAAGHVHVALRHGGAIASIDPVGKTILARRNVCVAPRGIAYEASSDNLYVACASGELVTLPATGTGAPTRTVMIEKDLRDVLLSGGQLYVSTLRTADVMQIAADGSVTTHLAPPALNGTPGVAWKTAAIPTGGFGAVLQSATNSPISTAPGGYGGTGCGGAVTNPAIAVWGSGTSALGGFELAAAAMPIDIAFDKLGNASVVFAGEWKMPGSPQVVTVPAAFFPVDAGTTVPPEDAGGFGGVDAGAPCVDQAAMPVNGQATSVAYDGQGKLYVQTREPASLVANFLGAQRTIALSTVSREDTGHDVFHSDQGGGIACSSCHLEGADDGRTWMFDGLGPRRTPTVLGTVQGTAPYHWMGEEPDLPTLYAGALARMDGLNLAPDQVVAETNWIEALAEPPALPGDATSIASGEALFQSSGCATCHSGPHFTNNLNEDVGTGGAFQVAPLLGVGWHPPYLHNGCAATLTQALDTTCAMTGHGSAMSLTTAQMTDLVAYLTSL